MGLVTSTYANGDEQAWSLLTSVTTNKVQQISVAPNGKYVAYLQSHPREPFTEPDGPAWSELYVVDNQGKRKPFIVGQVHVLQVTWSSDSRLLWLIAQKQTDPHFSLYAISIDGGEAQRVYQHPSPILGFALSPEDQSVVFWARSIPDEKTRQKQNQGFDAIVFEETLHNNQLWRLSLTEPGHPKLIYDKRHVISASFFEDSEHLLILESQNVLEDNILTPALVKIDINGNEILRFKHVGKVGKAIINGNNQIAFIGGVNASDPKAGQLFLLDEKFENAQLLLTEFKGHIQDIAWLNNSKIGFIAHQGTQAFWAEKKTQKPGSTFKKLINNDEILEQVSLDKHGQKVAFISHSPQHPSAAFWSINNQIIQVSDNNPHLNHTLLPKQQSLTFTARDGTELEGIYIHPLKKIGDAPPPVIMFVHGGPQAHFSNGWMDRYSHPAYYAASLGFASFFPNYRGSTGKGVAFSQLGQGDLAGKEFTDLVDAKQFLVEKKLANASQIGITGASYGGYAAAWAATAQSEHFAAAVMYAGISDQVSKFGTTDIPKELYQTQTKKWPWQHWNYLLQRSPINYVEQHHTPLLIVHGRLDERVDPGQALELYRHLKINEQAPVRLVLYPNEAHGNARVAAQLDYATRLMRWMTHFVIEKQTTLPDNSPPEAPIIYDR